MSPEAAAEYQKAKHRLQSLHDFVDVTGEMSYRIGLMWDKAIQLDDGTGQIFDKCVNAVFRKFATQSY